MPTKMDEKTVPFPFSRHVSSNTANHPGDTKSVVMASNPFSAGGFVVYPVFTNLSGNPELTNDQGKTMFYNTGDVVSGHEMGTKSATTPWVFTDVSLKITYEGELTTDSDIQAAWNTIENHGKVQVKITDGSNLSDGRGIKLAVGSETAPNTYTGTIVAEPSAHPEVSFTFTITTENLDFSAGQGADTGKQVATVAALSSYASRVWVGIKGIAGINQNDDTGYTMAGATTLIA